MASIDEELAKLQTDYDNKRAEITRKHEVLACGISELMEGYHPPFIHHTKLYGSVGSIHIHGTEYSSIQKGKNPDKDLLLTMLERFQPVPLSMVRDGCLSFRPTRAYDEKGEWTSVHPVIVQVDVFQSHRARFEWYAEIANMGLWEFSVQFPFHQTDLGTLDLRALYVGDHLTSWERCDIQPKHGADRIRYASGGREYPNSFTLYWLLGRTMPDIGTLVK